MKTKKSFVFLSLALASLLVLGGCVKGNTSESQPQPSSSGQQSESSEPQPSSSSEEAKTYTVRFVVNGEVVQTSQVVEGELAQFEGVIPPIPTPDPNVQTRFRKWDKDINQPITADTTFNAIFKDYALSQMVDDFESYTSTGRLLEANWMALTYSSSGWTDQTNAAVSLSTNSIVGNQALRLDAWSNDCDYKIAKVYDASPFTYAANALRVRMMFPRHLTVKILIHTETFTVDGKEYTPYFSYLVDSTTSDYAEYIIPLADAKWAAWGEQGKTMASVAEWAGLHVDDVIKYITRIEFYTRGATISGGAEFAGFLDTVEFLTIDNPTYSVVDEMKDYSVYTGVTTVSGQRVKITLGENGQGTASLLDLAQPLDIPGVYTVEDNKITFSSADDGAALVYEGQLLDGGQHIKYLASDGAFADEVENMDIHAVQVMDNFEQYPEDGVSWWNGNKDNPEARSGCRGAYYSEYYSGSADDSTEWGGSKWSLMRGNGDQLKMVTEDGNNYLSLKSSSGAAMRYMQWGMYDGSAEKQAYRGKTLSFWAKSEGVVTH